MTIKKPMKAPEPAAATVSTEASAAAAPGGATIADRFKLDLQDPNAKKAGAGKGTIVTVLAAVLALAVAGFLTFILYQHWEFLQNA